MSLLTVLLTLVRGVGTGVTWLFTGGRRKWTIAALMAVTAALVVRQVIVDRRTISKLSETVAEKQGQIDLLKKSRTADSKALTGNAAAHAAITRNEEVGKARTDAALAETPEWANEPVPVGVLDSLRQ